MVEDRITDGKRIAELLASELTGLDRPPLDRIAVVDADPDATPAEDGTLAYRVAVDGDPVGDVRMFPERVEVALPDAVPPDVRDGGRENAVDDPGDGDDSDGLGDPPSLDVAADDEGTTVVVRSVAAVKRARDLLTALAEARA